jgi:hypothetical protein
MEKKTFKINLAAVNDPEEVKNKNYGLYLPHTDYVFFNEYITKKLKSGELSYNFKKAFLDGLDLLQKENPDIEIIKDIPRRYYRGGKQKNAEEWYRSSIILNTDQINWINSFIAEKSKKELSYSQPDFIQELVLLLKKEK